MIQSIWSYFAHRIKVDANDHRPEIGFWDDAGYLMRRFPRSTQSVLDMGIWSGWLGALTKCVWHAKAFGLEVYPPYIEAARPFYDGIVMYDFAWGLPFPSQSIDVVCCLNTIEHVEDPFFVLGEMERVAKKAVFVSSTNFFMRSQAWDGNKAQLHTSLITARDMKDRGYTIRGAGFLVQYLGMAGRRMARFDSAYLAYKYLHGHHVGS